MPNIIKTANLIDFDSKIQIPDVADGEFISPALNGNDNTEPFLNLPKQDDIVAEEELSVKVVYRDTAEMSKSELSVIFADEIEQLKAESMQKAYSDALQSSKTHITECLNDVDKSLQKMSSDLNSCLQKYFDELKFLAIDIAEKMILEKISEDDLILKKLVLQSVVDAKSAAWQKIELSDQLVSLIDSLKAELSKAEYGENATLKPVPAAKDVCRIVTKDGITDATISVQADNLRAMFEE